MRNPSQPPTSAAEEKTAWARGADGVTAAVVGLHGWHEAAIVEHSGANAMGDRSATPVLFGRCGAGLSVFVTLHALTKASDGHPGPWASAAEVDGTMVRVRWASGRSAECDLATFVPWDHHTGPRAANL